MKTVRLLVAALIIALPATLLMAGSARAMPVFARQTGLGCPACHTVYPELTPLGRRFKLGGFTLTNIPPAVEVFNDNLPAGATGQPPQKQLSILNNAPTVLVQASMTNWNRPPPPGSAFNPIPAGSTTGHVQNDEIQFPQQASVVFAGAVNDHIGAWTQLTYFQQTGTFGIDTWDFRYADQTADKVWLWGVTFNNSPTFQDVLNTGGASGLPQTAFGIPYFPVPLTQAALGFPRTPLILNLVPGTAAGVGAYTFINDSIYLELSGYTAAKDPAVTFNDTNISLYSGTLQNVNPYWRAFYEKDWGNQSFDIGTIGMYSQFVPCTTIMCSPDLTTPGRYLDFGLDAQYQFIGDVHIVTAQAMWIHEISWNNPGLVGTLFSNTSNHLDWFSANVSYYYHRQYGGMISFGYITGSSDPIAYCTANGVAYQPPFGTCNGSPNAMWETFELDYMPWLNVKLFVTYNVFNRLDSAANAFIGQPNKVSDNNTVLLGLWTAF